MEGDFDCLFARSRGDTAQFPCLVSMLEPGHTKNSYDVLLSVFLAPLQFGWCLENLKAEFRDLASHSCEARLLTSELTHTRTTSGILMRAEGMNILLKQQDIPKQPNQNCNMENKNIVNFSMRKLKLCALDSGGNVSGTMGLLAHPIGCSGHWGII